MTFRFTPIRCRLVLLAFGPGACVGLLPITARAQTWSSTSIYVGEPWSDGTRWSGGVAPANDGTANVVFSQSNGTNIAFLDADWNVASVYFNSTPGLGVGQNSNPSIGLSSYGSSTVTVLTVQGGGIANASTYPITIKPTLVLARPQTWNVGTGGLVVNVVSGAGDLTKTGSGKLTLASTQSTFTGNLGIAAGTVFATDGAGSLGADNATVSLGNGATLSFSTPINQSTPYAIALNHTLTLNAGGGALTTFDGYTTFNAPITGPGSLTLGADTAFGVATTCGYNLGNTNTYSGGTFIGGGVTATVTGNQQALGTGNVTVGSGGVLALASVSNLAGSSRVILHDGANNLAPGALVLDDLSLDPASLVSSASTGGVIALGNLTWNSALDFSRIGNGKQALGAGSPSSIYGAATLSPGADGVYRLGGGTVAGVLTVSGADNVLSGAGPLVVGQNPGYASSLVPTGSSSNGVTLARANNFTGGTTLYGGSLAVGDDGALGTGTITFSGGVFGAAGGARNLSNPLVLQSVSLNNASSLTFSGPVDLNGGTGTVSAVGPAGGGTFTFANVISHGALTLTGGTYTLGAANTFGGGLTINNAGVRIASDANLGAAGASLALGGGSLTPLGATLTINRPVAITSSYSSIATNGGTVTLNGPFTTAANVTFTKRDAGTLVLTNPNNTAAIAAYGGTLQVDNVSAGSKGGNGVVTVNVSNGGTLAGVGPVGYTSVGSGHLAPGDHGPGTLTVGSGLSLFGGAALDFDLGTGGADQIVFNGHLFQVETFGSQLIAFNFTDAGGLAPGQTYKLIDWGTATTSGVTAGAFQLGTSPVGGTFSIANNGLFFTTAAYTPYQQWQCKYFGSINNPSAAPAVSPARDGIANLLKYALGLDPLHVATLDLPRVGSLPGYLTFTYAKPESVTDVSYAAEYSDDLTTWSSNGVVQETLADDGTTQMIRAKVASTETTRRFLRLTVASQ